MLALLLDSWKTAQDDLRRRVGEVPYGAWIESLTVLSLERGTVHLEAPSRWCAVRAERLFGPVIADCLSAQLGTRVTARVHAAPGSSTPDRLDVGPRHPVVDDSNKTAVLVLKSLLEGRDLPGCQFLFHGPSGVGKTFLFAWWRNLTGSRPKVFALQELHRAFQAVVRDRRYAAFRTELSGPQPLVLDEVHRIAGKKRLQRELLEVLGERQRLGRLTLLASRWHPREIRELDEGLCTWLLAGFVTRIDPPGAVGRLHYLRALEGSPSRNGRKSEVEELARRVQGTWPEVREAWNLQRERRSPGCRTRYLELIEPGSAFWRLLARITARLSVTEEELMGRGQARRVTQARKVLAWLCVQEGLSQAEVGRFMRGRQRATVSYWTRSLRTEMARSAEVRRLVESLL